MERAVEEAVEKPAERDDAKQSRTQDGVPRKPSGREGRRGRTSPTVAELKATLKVLGGATTGNKAELQARLDLLQGPAAKQESREPLEKGAGELPERTEGPPHNRARPGEEQAPAPALSAAKARPLIGVWKRSLKERIDLEMADAGLGKLTVGELRRRLENHFAGSLEEHKEFIFLCRESGEEGWQ